MRKWGVVVSVFYAVIVLGFLVPGAIIIAGATGGLRSILSTDMIAVFKEWVWWLPIGAVLSGQAILLFLSVDATQKRLKPRTHIALSVIISSMLFGLMSLAVVLCIDGAIRGDAFGDNYLEYAGGPFGLWGILWVLWGIVFYSYFRNSSNVTARAVSWLLGGSVLELLIAVPCHVIVRRRHDCSAPVVTSFGIVTGIAVMLLSFGPSVLLLYKKRLDEYAVRKTG